MTRSEMARMIDHTLLKATATVAEIRTLCDEARTYKFGAVCVNPVHVAQSVRALLGTGVAVATVIGFPLGANQSETKVAEARLALLQGATELDMVLNVGALKERNLDLVERDIKAVVGESKAHEAKAYEAGAQQGWAVVKVIIETCYLTDEEKVLACQIAKRAGADFVKTSTGFGTGGATVEDVRLMRQTVGPELGVKASGGVRTTADALAMVEAGATRIGASAGVAILAGLPG
ncbi:MAG: deoxyribose-phosphate aldolase [Symbiobacteriia bacterium]